MRAWFESCSNYLRSDNENLHFGVVAYRHKRKEWKGFTVSVFILDGGFSFNYVNNYTAYKEVMDRTFRIRRRGEK